MDLAVLIATTLGAIVLAERYLRSESAIVWVILVAGIVLWSSLFLFEIRRK